MTGQLIANLDNRSVRVNSERVSGPRLSDERDPFTPCMPKSYEGCVASQITAAVIVGRFRLWGLMRLMYSPDRADSRRTPS